MNRQRDVRGTIDYEHTLDGVKLSFEAGTRLITSGVQYLPDIEIPDGRWNVRGEQREQATTVTVSSLAIYTLSPILTQLCLDRGERVELEFDFLRRQAVLRRKESEPRAE
jgi:hypothetical protein